MNTLLATILAAILLAVTTAQGAFTYTTNADGTDVTITGYSGPNAVVIPSTINDLTVTDIGETAFFDTDITSVSIPESVTNIGAASFEDCEDLTNAFLPNTLVRIGDGAFDQSGLTTITIPKSVTNIGNGSFSACDSLTNVTFEVGLFEIQSNLFGGCYGLANVVIPASITNIGDSAFGDCDNLTNIFFSGNAPALGQYAFAIFNAPETGEIPIEYVATAYYLPGTTGWAQFTSNTFVPANPSENQDAEFVPTVLWNPKIQTTGTNFGVQNGQYGFDVTATTNLPVAIEACDDLTQSNWVVLQRLILTNGLYHFSEPFDTNKPTRFYRIGFP
ncbi:MAG TPA: leucine-rich repeat domain-containing protein [Verrucomicrobiae bacterium]|jgi:hypothetical protein